MIKEFKKLKWTVGLMIITIVVMLYTGFTGLRLLGSTAEKWTPEGQTSNHK